MLLDPFEVGHGAVLFDTSKFYTTIRRTAINQTSAFSATILLVPNIPCERNEHMTFHQFTSPDGEPFGSFEVFQDVEASEASFYWQSCFPDCLPDSDAVGPFQTEAEAIEYANS